jgi:hypothetical protein
MNRVGPGFEPQHEHPFGWMDVCCRRGMVEYVKEGAVVESWRVGLALAFTCNDDMAEPSLSECQNEFSLFRRHTHLLYMSDTETRVLQQGNNDMNVSWQLLVCTMMMVMMMMKEAVTHAFPT